MDRGAKEQVCARSGGEVADRNGAGPQANGTGLSADCTLEDCRSVFDFWRTVLMGNRGSGASLNEDVGGYFYRQADSTGVGRPPAPIPLGIVRQDLVQLIERTCLTDNERSTLRLYFGLDGLPLPFSSSAELDIAAGRDESSPRGTCKAAIGKIALVIEPRPIAGLPVRRPSVDPLLQSWFRGLALSKGDRRATVARAYVRAVSRCDGPYAPATLAALDRWYRDCGLPDGDLRRASRSDGRPNGNALARAAALMEVALFEEIKSRRSRNSLEAGDPPAPAPGEEPIDRLPEMVTHPNIVDLLDDDLSPGRLVSAAVALKEQALSGTNVAGQLALFLRCVRPRLCHFTAHEVERLAAAITYVAAADGNPFLALEWLGQLLDRAGITDRTFTVLVNAIEAASSGGYHQLAGRIDRYFKKLERLWEVPPNQIAFVERVEAEQQRLVANAFRLEQLARMQATSGDHIAAIDSLRHSAELAVHSARVAHQVLTDTATFPARPIGGKSGLHGGDLTSPWLLAALVRVVEPLAEANRVATDGHLMDAELRGVVAGQARFAEAVLRDCHQGPFDRPYFRDWHETVGRHVSRLASAA